MTQCFYVITSIHISEKKEMITSTLHSSYEDKNTCIYALRSCRIIIFFLLKHISMYYLYNITFNEKSKEDVFVYQHFSILYNISFQIYTFIAYIQLNGLT